MPFGQWFRKHVLLTAGVVLFILITIAIASAETWTKSNTSGFVTTSNSSISSLSVWVTINTSPPLPPPPPEPLPFTPGSPVFTSIYDYGSADTGFWRFKSYGTYLLPSLVWSSGPGNWEWTRSKLTTGDFNGDGKSDEVIFYDYGSANTGLWLFRAESFSPFSSWSSGVGNWEWSRSKIVSGKYDGDTYEDIAIFYDYGGSSSGLWTFHGTSTGYFGGPFLNWSSGPGNWDWSRSKIVSGDFYGDGHSDIAVFYDYGGSSSGLWVFNGTSAGFSSPSLKWASGAGNWDWSRSKLTTGDFNGDGRTDIAVLYDYGSANTGIWIFQSTGTGFNLPAHVWSSGIGNWEWARTKIVPGDFDGDNKGDIGALYDYGGENTSIWVFRGSNFPPIPFWSSGPGNWEWSRTRLPGEDR